MASRDFVRASSQTLTHAAAVASGPPVTMACWYRPVEFTNSIAMMALGRSGVADDRLLLFQNGGAANDPVSAQQMTASTAFNAASTSGPNGVTAWYHACGVFAGNNSRTAYFNGANSATDTNALGAGTFDRTSIGCRYASGALGVYFDGQIAHAAMWNVALTATEVAILAEGLDPRFVQPDNLLAYWPLMGAYSTEIDTVGRFEMTVSGASKSELAPRIWTPTAKKIIRGASVVATGNPWHHYAQMRAA